MVVLEKTSRIENDSQEFYLEMIRTLPHNPNFVEIWANAEGIQSKAFEEPDNQRYYDECFEKGVVPSSGVRLVYDSQKNIFCPNTLRGSFDTTKGLFKGGKIHKIGFEMKIPAAQGFEKFRKETIEELLDNGYVINRGNIVLSTYHLTGYDQGDYPDTELTFEKRRFAELKLGREMQESELEKVAEWFEKLAVKYQS